MGKYCVAMATEGDMQGQPGSPPHLNSNLDKEKDKYIEIKVLFICHNYIMLACAGLLGLSEVKN